MPVYMLHGFRWPRAGFTGIRVYIVLHNLEEAAAEYIQQPLTTELLVESFNKTQADLVPRLPELSFIEQYDPADESSGTVSQEHAYVGARVLEIADDGGGSGGGQNIQDCVEQGSGLTDDQTAALEELRDRLAPGEKIGWYLVYNGDPERWFPESEDEDYESEDSYEEESQTRRQSQIQSPREEGTKSAEPNTPPSYTGENAPGEMVFTIQCESCQLSSIHTQNDLTLTLGLKDEEKVKLKGEVHRLVAPRDQKYQSNFVEFRRSTKVVYRRYAGLFFCVCVDANDNELAYLEAIHFFVEVLDQFFGNVCELDLVFNFYKVYAILDEVFLAGEIQETSKQVVLTRLEHLDKLE
ncbi:hypothetical protein N7457_009712 [Penicillium paradoxum]|uniref:uncharacterized protein n=1 Tax=Penicillium paradoxum TaxID=176176 RepID=UPI0025480251|nr:uncharacterized protein N7457_009712 [Penicillium paradoxum]KAJ5774816.1 hypothetical protein N7457_009712 [Penicillium paradoxum]